jgi:hypothetical protein
MKCSNCDQDALYTVAPVTASKVHYCNRDLPDYLRLGALEGLYPVETTAPVSSKKKSTTPPAEDTPAETE